MKVLFTKKQSVRLGKNGCVICDFPLDAGAKGVNTSVTDMTCYNFIMKKEHKFLRNMFQQEELESSENLKT